MAVFESIRSDLGPIIALVNQYVGPVLDDLNVLL
jgi:hypothetical protein